MDGAVRVSASRLPFADVEDDEIPPGQEGQRLVILGVGKAPARISNEGQLIKANCRNLAGLKQPGFATHLVGLSSAATTPLWFCSGSIITEYLLRRFDSSSLPVRSLSSSGGSSSCRFHPAAGPCCCGPRRKSSHPRSKDPGVHAIRRHADSVIRAV